MDFNSLFDTFKKEGHAIIPNLYSNEEITSIVSCLNAYGKEIVDNSRDLFAIRQLFHRIPELTGPIFNSNLKVLLSDYFDNTPFLTKAIYFDKPSSSNWFVAYHQDLSISVKDKSESIGYKNWTFKKGQYGVRPPLEILEDTLTVRIHLDDTTKENGALKVLPESHRNGIQKNNDLGISQENEVICNVNKGGVMLMSPLTMHASHRTTNGKRRRVIHLEFCSKQLHSPLEWLERKAI